MASRSMSIGAGDHSSTDEEMQTVLGPPRSSWRHIVAAGVGALALLGCVVFLGRSLSSPVAAPPHVVTARTLFEDPEIHQVAAENILKVGRNLISADAVDSVHAAVAEALTNVSVGIKQRDPKYAAELDTIQLSAQQKAALAHVLRFQTDPRVQQLGLDVARVVGSSTGTDPAAIERELLEKMAPRAAEIRKLHDEVIPAPLRSTGGDDDWSMDLSEDRLRMMRSFQSWKVDMSMSKPTAEASARRLGFMSQFMKQITTPDTKVSSNVFTTTNKPMIMAEKGLGIVSAVAEEGRVIFDLVSVVPRLFGKRGMHMPAWAKSFVGGFAGVTTLASCELDAFAKDNQAEMMTCPLKLGSQGMDFMHFFLKKFMGTDKGLGKSGVETLH